MNASIPGSIVLLLLIHFQFASGQDNSVSSNVDAEEIQFSAIGPSSATISWKSCLNADNELRFRELGSQEWMVINTSNRTQFQLNHLKPKAHYEIEIKECPQQGEDQWSSAQDLKTIGRPNLVVIVADDGRYDNYAVTGGPSFFQSPNINRIANEGVNFKYCFPSFSLCSPSRANIVTGLMTHHNGIIRNGTSDSLTLPTVAEILNDSGYYCGWVGKYGFNKFPQPGYKYYLESSNDNYWDTYYFTNQRDTSGRWEILPGHKTNVFTNAALYFLNHAPTDQPFLLFLDHKAPHVPLEPRAEDSDLYKDDSMPFPKNFSRYRINYPSYLYDCHAYYGDSDSVHIEYLKYYELLAGIDYSVGQVISLLEQKGILDSTLIIYTSDNGLLKGEHRLQGKELANEESIRLPMFIRYPAWFSANTHVDDEFAMNIDIAPTLIDAAGIQNPVPMDGVSLRELVNKTKTRQDLLLEFFNKGDCTPTFRSIRSFDYKYTYNYCDNITEEFFDLKNDSLENVNQINNPAYQSIIQSYRFKLDSIRTLYGDTLNDDTIINCELEVPTGIDDPFAEDDGFNLYPNPGNGDFTMNLIMDKNTAMYITITDVLGRIITERSIPYSVLKTAQNFSLRNQPPGTYFINMRSGTRQNAVKYIKIT